MTTLMHKNSPALRAKLACAAAAAFMIVAAGRPHAGEAPARAETAVEAETRRVVLFERSVTGGHAASREDLRAALARLASAQGFRLQVTTDPADLNDQNLATAQVLVLGNGDGDVVPAGAARAAVEKFVRDDGKGLLVVHAGAAFIREWSFLAEGVARQYDHHAPAITRATLYLDTLAGAGHRVHRGLPPRAAITEEFYGFASSPRAVEGVTVLLALDEASAQPPLATRMGDHPLVWVRRVGKGQVLTHTLGHNRSAWADADSLGQRLLGNEIAYLSEGGGGCGGALCKGALSSPGAEAAARGIEILAFRNALSIRLPPEGNHQVRVLDVAGKSVYARSARGEREVRVKGLKAGTYLVQVAGDDGKTLRRRMAVP